jgi:hypothetical protein
MSNLIGNSINNTMKRYLLIIAVLFLYQEILPAQQNTKSGIMLKDSPDGVYLMLGNQRFNKNEPMEVKLVGAIIYRAVGNEKFKEIGQLKPAATPDEFKKIAGKTALADIAEFKNLKSETEAWDFIQKHPKLSDYGFFAMNVKLGLALGAYFLDKDVLTLKSTDIRYQVKYLTNDGSVEDPIEGSIRLGQPAAIPPPRFLSKMERDSFIEVKWFLPARGAEEAVFAIVFKSKGNSNTYEKTGQVFANINQPLADSVLFTWLEKIQPGVAYHYFIQPTTMTFHPGANSDTVHTVSVDFTALQQITELRSKDTTSGIWIQWSALPGSPIYSGLAIERSVYSSGPFYVIDTIPASAVSYLDTKIKPNQSYYYRLHAVTVRGVALPASDYTTAFHAKSIFPPDAPRNLTLTVTSKGRLLKWNKNLESDIAGYFVLRTGSSDKDPEVISLLVKDTVFTDTATLYSRNAYYYEVKAYTNGDLSGANSNRVVFTPESTILPRTVTGIRGYAEYGKASISWDDIRILDTYIAGYNVYRKSGKYTYTKENNDAVELSRNGFVKITGSVSGNTTLNDTDLKTGDYSYCVTATDIFGKESFASDVITLSVTAMQLMPPSNVTARKTSKGVAVDWNTSLQSGLRQYIVYRRTAGETQVNKLSTLDAGKESYLDTTVKTGVTYYYSVAIAGESGVSDRSLEAGVAN